MSIKNFWLDVLRTAAILGVVMAVSHLVEQHLLVFSSLDITTATLLLCVEYLIAAVAFVAIVYYFTRNVAKNWNDNVELGDGQVVEVKFTYSRALSYILMVSMLAGVIVGLANTIYIDIKGYDIFVAGVLSRYDEVFELMASMTQVGADQALLANYDDMMRTFTENFESMERPSIFSNIISHMTNYMLSGVIVGLVVAYFARRNVKKSSMM